MNNPRPDPEIQSAPDAKPDSHVRIRDESSKPDSEKRGEETIPGDRGAREQESAAQGSE